MSGTSIVLIPINETTFEYLNRYGRSWLTKVTSPSGLTAEFTYDSKGNCTSAKGPNNETWTLTPNTQNLLSKITDPLSHETNFSYDSRANLSTVTNALSHDTGIEYDDLDLPNKITDALTHDSNYQNNGDGATKQLTDNRSKTYQFEYQDRFLRNKLKFPGGSQNASAYDLNQRLSTWTNRTGTVVTISRDDAGRMINRSWTGGYGVSYTYDDAGRITQADSTYPWITLHKSYDYDSEGRVSTVTLEGRTATLHYDTNNRLSQMDYPAGFSVNYAYDSDGRLYTATLGATVLATYGYNTKGQLATVTTGNGVVTTYTHDELNRVTAISAASGATVLWASGYGYDAIGNRTYATGLYGGTGGDAYQYDNLGQLTGVKYNTATASSGYASATSPASTETTAYDAAGNRSSQTIGSTTTSYTVNDLNQYTQAGGCNPTYDGCGNMNLYNPDGNDDWDLTYSPFGQLIGAESPDFQISYAYDAFGNRAYEKSNGVYSRKLLHVGSQLLDCYETPSGGGSAITKSYVYGPGIDHPICEITGNAATTKYLLQDANANVVALISAAGAVTERYTYDAWGKPTVYDASWTVQGSAPQSRFLFTGRDYDAETGLYHYRTRAYSPKIGRFLQPDKIDFSGADLNLYRYVSNNPINFVDPLGMNSSCRLPTMDKGEGDDEDRDGDGDKNKDDDNDGVDQDRDGHDGDGPPEPGDEDYVDRSMEELGRKILQSQLEAAEFLSNFIGIGGILTSLERAAAKAAAKDAFRKEAGDMIKRVLRDTRTGGTNRIKGVGVKGGNTSYRPKLDGNYTVTPASGKASQAQHFP
ncbi:MAG: hypothetical protein PHC88_13075 [Terrimicrobiaceae bacterium]|nr:hypothetical protein [Terrimicrobiaceae bacterium]